MYTRKGQAIFGGIVEGNIISYERAKHPIPKFHISDCAVEKNRFAEGVSLAKGQLQTLYEKSIATIGQQDALVFGVHQMILDDEEFYDAVLHMIEEEQVNAEYAVYEVTKKIELYFDDQGREADIWDVAERLIRTLTGNEAEEYVSVEQGILIVEELFPSEVMKFDFSKVKGVVLKKGSVNSHASILLKSRQVPSILCPEYVDVPDGVSAILDAADGCLYVEPDEKTIGRMQRKREIAWAKSQELLRLKHTKTKVLVCANAGNLEDVKKALELGADGIGLVRSEMLCMKAQKVLGEEEQFGLYKEILEKMKGKKVVVRTWDFGEDKNVEGLDTKGHRGIRFCLEEPMLFKEQLRALYRASVYGNLEILLPMISSVDEVKQVEELLEEAKRELANAGKEFEQSVKLGAMIETPAAVLVSRQLAKEVDFFNIGTNDLTQYALGIDRQKDSYDAHHPAIMELIRMTIKNAHLEGITVGICGELGADESLTKVFASMGIDELSVIPSKVLAIRKELYGERQFER